MGERHIRYRLTGTGTLERAADGRLTWFDDAARLHCGWEPGDGSCLLDGDADIMCEFCEQNVRLSQALTRSREIAGVSSPSEYREAVAELVEAVRQMRRESSDAFESVDHKRVTMDAWQAVVEKAAALERVEGEG